jgi:hypothetical protein
VHKQKTQGLTKKQLDMKLLYVLYAAFVTTLLPHCLALCTKGDKGASLEAVTLALGSDQCPGGGLNITNAETGAVVNKLCLPPPSPAGSMADFYAMQPGDNPTTVALGAAVNFPRTASLSGLKVVRNDNSSFNLTTAGRYLVQFTVTVTEAGQLVIALDSGVGFAEQPHAVYGRAATGSPIVGMAIITTTVANTVLRLQNPAANAAPLTITSAAGGVTPSTSHLLIIAL